MAVEVGFCGVRLVIPAWPSSPEPKKKLLAEMLTEIADRGTRNLEVQLAWCCPATWGIVRAEMWTQKRQCCSLTADNGRKGREVNKSSVGNRSGPDRDGGVYGSKRCFSMFGCRCVSLSLPRPRQGGKQRARVCAAGHRRAGVDDVVFVGGRLNRARRCGGEKTEKRPESKPRESEPVNERVCAPGRKQDTAWVLFHFEIITAGLKVFSSRKWWN